MAHLDSLVVLDSNPRSSAALSFGFQREGFKVYSTSDSGDALVMAQNRAAQLLVVSTQNGHGSSLDLVGKLREEEATKELPIVVLGERRVREPALRAGADEFVSRPAFIRDVVTLSKLAVAMRQDGDGEGVVGLLEDYGLYFLTRALAVAGRSAVIELERGRRRGEVQVSKGEVVSARLGRMSGLAAFNQLLLWGEAAMHLRFESPAGERKINLSVDELLAQGADFAKKLEKLAEKIGGAQAVYRQAPTRAAESRAKIPAEVMGLLKLYDGKRPIIDVIEDSPFKPADSIKITYRLRELGAIEPVQSEHVDSPLTARLAVRDWLLGAPPVPADRSTVTEAGRRAAEAYAEEQARRAREKRPAEDLLPVGADTLVDAPRPVIAPPPAAEEPEPAPREANAPTQPVHDRSSASKSKKHKNKHKNKHRAQPDMTVPFSKISVPPPAPPVAQPEPQPVKAQAQPAKPQPQAQPAKPQPQAAKPQPHTQPAKPQPQAQAAKLQPAKPQPKKPEPKPAKLSPAGAAGAATKEPVFSDDDEEFFAKESELHKIDKIEDFSDLDSGASKQNPKRGWFGWKPKKK